MMHLKLAMTTAVLVVAGVASAATRTWTGGGDDALASTDANWQEGARPQDGDDIVLNSGAAAMTWDLSITVASWTQDGYTGTVTFETDYSDFAEFIITGNCSFNSGTWTHVANGTTQTRRLSVSVGGDLTMGANAKIDVTGLGYTAIANQPNYGLKTGNLTVEGGAYGGYAADNSLQCGHLPPYGSYRMPIDCGCPGNRAVKSMGGGAVALTVGGAFAFNGKIIADGIVDDVVHYEGGSGGGVLVRAGTIAGTGTISANAPLKGRGTGSGGRISVILTQAGATFADYDLSARASATSKSTWTPREWDHGACGTIYGETPADAEGQGWMIFKGIDITPSDPMRYGTPFTPDVKELTFAKITLRNTGILAVRAGETLHVENTVFDYADTSLNYIYVDGGEVDYGEGGIVRGPIKYASGLDHKGNFTVGDGTSLTIAGESKVTGNVTVLAGGSLTWNGIGTVGGSVSVSGTMAFNKPTTIAGDVTVQSGGKLTHSANTTTEENKLNLTVGGSVTVAEGGAIDVSAMGYAPGQGAGKPVSGSCGGTYGGRGYCANGAVAGACYGSILCPTNCGSGGSRPGMPNAGGSVVVKATGAITVNGEVNADCPNSTADIVYYTGSGGSVWLVGSTIDGTGSIHANGGGATGTSDSNKGFFGGGGRISLVSTAAIEDSATLTVTAYGGRTTRDYVDGSAGTVYRENASQEKGHGNLSIVNASVLYTTADHHAAGDKTDFPAVGLAEETKNVTLSANYHATVNLIEDATVADIKLQNSGRRSTGGTTGVCSRLFLNGHTLSVKAKRHAISPDDATQVVPGEGGSVYWIPRGFMLLLR